LVAAVAELVLHRSGLAAAAELELVPHHSGQEAAVVEPVPHRLPS
jgi:hypothetical protein